MRKLASLILIVSLLFPGPVYAGSMTANNYFYLPSYGEKGPAAYNYYNAAMNATDSTIASLVADTASLSALVAGWAIEDQIVTLIPVTCTYSDADTFILPGDYTSRFAAGAVVQVQVAAGMVYSTVASSSYAAPNTTVNLNDAILTNPITRVYVVATRDGLWPNGPGYVVARDYGTTRAALAAADAVATAAGKELLITYAFSVDDNLTLSAPRVRIMPGAVLPISTTKTLTIAGDFQAGRYQVFDCTGTGKAAFTGNVPARFPEWWGAAPDGVTDSTAAIQAAYTSLPAAKGGIIDFGVGFYLITPGQIVISIPGIVLQGKAAATDGVGTLAGTVLKSAAGTGKMISFLGATAATPLDSCQANDIAFWGNEETVTGLSLKWVSNFRSRNAWITECYDDGAYLEQVWDSSFYDLEIEACGAQGTGKVGLRIYNGAIDNSNSLRFYAFHAEGNYGDDVWVDASAAGAGGNYNILFLGGKAEKNTAVGDYSTKAFYISGWNGATGKPNQGITIRDFSIINYYETGDIGIYFEGDGFMTVDNCFFTNNSDGATGIKIEGPVVGPYTHRVTNNRFTNVAQEITIESTTPRNRVWTEGNTNSLWSESDSRININSDLVKDRRGWVLASTTPAVAVSTSGTGEDNLQSTVIPANLLSTYGCIKVFASGTVTGSAGNKTIKLYFGATAVTVFPAAALTGSWQLEARIQNATAGAQSLDWKFTVNGAPATVSGGQSYPLIDTTVDVTVKLTGECANGADTIDQVSWSVVEE